MSNAPGEPGPVVSDEPQQRFPSRRQVLAAAGAALACSASAGAAATAEGRTEGYFFVFTATGQDTDDRVFFISSEWLEMFEVTDVYLAAGYDPKDVVKNIRKAKALKGKTPHQFSALYSDLEGTQAIPGAAYVPPPPPNPSQTYLAMMIAPAAVPV